VNGSPTWSFWNEYDLVECGGDRQGGSCNVHYGTTNHQTGPHHFDGDLTQWHTYGCELTADGVTFYLDGKVVKKLVRTDVVSQHPHRLGVQLDVGRTNRNPNGSKLYVDWAKVLKPTRRS
jgi:beta-glucanase (GH16 family)